MGVRPPAWCRKEAHYSWAGAGSPGEVQVCCVSQRRTEPSLPREFQALAGGPDGPSFAPLSGAGMTLGSPYSL